MTAHAEQFTASDGRRTRARAGRTGSSRRAEAMAWRRRASPIPSPATTRDARSGRPKQLMPAQVSQLDGIIDSGPVAYGFSSGVWTSPMIERVIEEEFGVSYHP